MQTCVRREGRQESEHRRGACEDCQPVAAVCLFVRLTSLPGSRNNEGRGYTKQCAQRRVMPLSWTRQALEEAPRRDKDLVGWARDLWILSASRVGSPTRKFFSFYHNCIRSVKYVVNVKVCMQTSPCVSGL